MIIVYPNKKKWICLNLYKKFTNLITVLYNLYLSEYEQRFIWFILKNIEKFIRH